GIIQGTGVLVSLAPEGSDATRLLDEKIGLFYSTSKSKTSRQMYPTSLMGTMALLRQVNLDADWYAKGNIKEKDRALEAFNANRNEIQILNASSKENVLRFDKIGDQFNTQYIFVAGGDEYEWIKDIKATNAQFIVPVNFPDAYDMEDPLMASSVSLADLKAWNQAPSNPKILADNNITFAFTSHDLKEEKDLFANLQKAIEYGLDKTKALEALTTIPAQIIGKSTQLGHLKTGAYANFLITSGDIFDKETTIYQNWVTGVKDEITPMDTKDLRGDYTFKLNNTDYELSISGDIEKLKSKVKTEAKELGSKINFSNDWLTLTFSTIDTTKQEFVRVVSKISDSKDIKGKAIFPNGKEFAFNATKKASEKAEEKKNDKDEDKESETPKLYPVTYPNMAYGFSSLPEQETILFKNATVWTNETEGILEQTDVLIKNGKISKIGKNLSAGNATIVDATGKHLTSGIIDEHSHIATASVNEAGQNSTAEVSIE
ncbi:MAG: amidohydrolase, partial [Flavobacteriaceae bacterium]|nr:amidohydrolase [Flavobacteriaceae bacterium]